MNLLLATTLAVLTSAAVSVVTLYFAVAAMTLARKHRGESLPHEQDEALAYITGLGVVFTLGIAGLLYYTAGRFGVAVPTDESLGGMAAALCIFTPAALLATLLVVQGVRAALIAMYSNVRFRNRFGLALENVGCARRFSRAAGA